MMMILLHVKMITNLFSPLLWSMSKSDKQLKKKILYSLYGPTKIISKANFKELIIEGVLYIMPFSQDAK